MINKRIAALEAKIAALEARIIWLEAKQPVQYVLPYLPIQPHNYIRNTTGCAPAVNGMWQVISI